MNSYLLYWNLCSNIASFGVHLPAIIEMLLFLTLEVISFGNNPMKSSVIFYFVCLCYGHFANSYAKSAIIDFNFLSNCHIFFAEYLKNNYQQFVS